MCSMRVNLRSYLLLNPKSCLCIILHVILIAIILEVNYLQPFEGVVNKYTFQGQPYLGSRETSNSRQSYKRRCTWDRRRWQSAVHMSPVLCALARIF